MKIFYKLLFILTFIAEVFTQTANAQITVAGSNTKDGNYTSLTKAAGAFAALNSITQAGQTITITITADVTDEDGSTALTGSSGMWTSLTINPSGGAIRTISGSVAAPLIDMKGADNVTIDGRAGGTGETKDLIISNTSTSENSGTSTVRMYNGANNNTIKYCTIKGSTTDGSGGIIFLGAASASTGNTIDNNNITNAADANRPINAIYSGGAANTVTISNNNIYDFLNPGNNSNGINLNTSTGASTISGNSLYETTTFVPSNSGNFYPIYINTDAAGFTISGNYIGGSSANCTGTWTKTNAGNNSFFGININSLGTGTPTVIKGNTINGFSWSNSEYGNCWLGGISVGAGDVTLGVSGEPNTIGSISGAPNFTYNFGYSASVVVPILLNGSGYINCQYNNIGGITCNNTNPEWVTRMYCICRGNNNASGIISNNTIGSATNPISLTSPSTNDWQWLVGIENQNSASTGLNISNNNISYLNNSNTNMGFVSGIRSYYQAVVFNISGNNIHDLTIACTNGGSGRDAAVRGGIWISDCTQFSITNNTVYNLTNTNTTFNGYMYGIFCTGGSSVNDCSGNTVYNIKATGTGAGPFMYGIYFMGNSENTHAVNTIKRNYIYGFTSSGVTTNCNNTRYYGIFKQYSTDAVIANNIMNFGGNTMSTIYGIYEEGNNVARISNVYFNTVYISGSPTAGGLSSYALYSAGNYTRTFKNNILYNARSNNGGVGNHYCIAYGSTVANSDYNDLYAPGSTGCMGYYNGNAYGPLATWRTITGSEAHSLNINPSFSSPGGTLASDYHTSAILPGISGTGIDIDYLGHPRATTPKMGALEDPNYLWQGETSTDFATATNWAGNEVPSSGSTLSFAASPSNNCVLDQDRTIKNLNNEQGTYNLVINGKTLTITGNITLTNSAFIDATAASSGVVFAGTAAQTINSTTALTFNNLTINNSLGVTLSNVNATVTGTLTFTSGLITTGANYLIVGSNSACSDGTVSGAGAGKYVYGNLRRYVPNAATTISYDIGDATNYTPVSITFAGTTSGCGYLDASTMVLGSPPAVASGLSQTKYLNRKWTITNNGVSDFTSYSPTFTFVPSDIVGSANTANLMVKKWSGSAWSPTTNGTRTSTSTQCTLLNSFGDFYIGESAVNCVISNRNIHSK